MVCYFDEHRRILVKGYSNKKEFILLVIRNVRIVRCFVTIESVCLSWLSGEVS